MELETRRAALLVEYDGSRFHGLQRQNHTPITVQEEIEKAARVIGTSEPRFVASGRTDAGVHALGQVVALDVPARLPQQRLALALNANLPREIRVRRGVHCAPDFNPRIDARMRTYVYRICSRDPVPPIYRNFVAHTLDKLDADKTRAAAAAFVGKHELRAWRSSICEGKRTELTIAHAQVFAPGEGVDEDALESGYYWRFVFRARSFLHHQVRFMAGALTAVGGGRLPLEELRDALAEGRRPIAVKCESACGLCFTRVEFAEKKDPFAVSDA